MVQLRCAENEVAAAPSFRQTRYGLRRQHSAEHNRRDVLDEGGHLFYPGTIFPWVAGTISEIECFCQNVFLVLVQYPKVFCREERCCVFNVSEVVNALNVSSFRINPLHGSRQSRRSLGQ